MDAIDARLEAARKELLDLGLRNPLINYRPLKARGLEIVDETPAEIVRILVAEACPFTFRPQPESPTDEPDALGQPNNATDDQLQTPYSSAELQKRLLTSYYTAVSTIEEQGVNILYLAFGMLHWHEPQPDAPKRRAPLILIPVTLHREEANTPFRLRYTGTDISDNLSMRLKCAADFDLTLPSLPLADVPDVAAYCQQMRQAIAQMPGWSVDETAVILGFFSFNKSLMVHDLEPANWPVGRQPAVHPILQALLHPAGFGESSIGGDDSFLDDHLPLSDSHQVMDADSSQMQAILDVNDGRNLVIQGPPGTGKSQTITNLIAEALGQGKTVLFVAEKLAALEVVKRRLDDIGLGDAALELHSHKSTKRSFLDELARTLKLGQPRADGRFPELEALTHLRTRLNEYSRALNEPVGSSGVTLYQAYGRALQLQARLADLPRPSLNNQVMRGWSPETYQVRLSQVQSLQAHLQSMGVPVQHPFWGSGQRELADVDVAIAEIRQLGQAALVAQAELLQTVRNLSEHLHTAVPHTPQELGKLLFDSRQLLVAPTLYAVDVDADAWHTQAEPLLAALEAGWRISQCHAQYDDMLIPEAWALDAAQDVMPIRQGLMAGPKWWRSLSGRYRQARQQLAGLCRRALPNTHEQQLGAVDAILEVQRSQPILAQMSALLPQLFTVRWQKEASEWPELLRVARWLVEAHQEIRAGRYDAALLAYAAQGVHGEWLRTAVAAIEQARGAYGTAVTHLFSWLQIDETGRQTFMDAPLATQQESLSRMMAGADRFHEMVAYNQMAHQLQADGLADLVSAAHIWPHGATHLTDLFRLTWFTGLIEQTAVARQILNNANSDSQNEAVQQFQALDSAFLVANRVRLAQAHWQQLPRYAAGGQMGLLQSEMSKQRQHKPIRTLMREAGRAIQRIKPVFMMSPLSIATFLPPDSLSFDLVIFDEASQVRPVDALGAILRGKQVVVVGDSRQLPPTTFFERIVEDTEILGNWDIDQYPNTAISQYPDIPITQLPNAPISSPESILDLFCAQNAPQRMLRWHYRSRHESLIAISNRAFYDRQLVIFPSPDAARQELGLRLHVLPETVYERGGSRTNPAEAQAVAAAVMAHAGARPWLTLGVVAFSTSQSEAIRDQLEQMRRADPANEPFFNAHPAEPFFVKNLENVQGDERDVIFISVGYGRAADGSVSLNFGPINQPGGERRLNVLITRARQRCEIFSNLTAVDIDADRVAARGVAVLKEYLHYAETGQLPELAPESAAQAAPFEEVVAASLRQHGYRVAHRVGDGSMRVDVAVLDDARPGYYRVGLECDGDNYHLARSARDRDRIQAQILAKLGWRIIRVWSHAWWQDSAGELARLLAAIETVNSKQYLVNSGELERVSLERYAPLESVETARPMAEYKLAQIGLPSSKSSFSQRYREVASFRKEVQNCLDKVLVVESPIHQTELLRRLWYAAGYKTLTANEEIAFRILSDAVGHGRARQRGDFLWTANMVTPPVRNRASLPPVSRKFEFVAPQEIDEAVFLVVADAVEIARDDVPLLAGRLLGFRQLGEGSATAVQQSIDRLVAQHRLVEESGYVRAVR